MTAPAAQQGSVWEVFKAFLWLGLTSFGGPVAHLGYFRTEFVHRREWLTEKNFAELVALCQFLPGPASSQVGFAIGLMRAGGAGAAAAFAAFTLPSAAALVLFALGAGWLAESSAAGLISGLKIVAVSIVAHAVWGMARTLCPDRTRTAIALTALALVLAVSGPLAQVGAIAAGAVLGGWFCSPDDQKQRSTLSFPVTRPFGLGLLVVFLVLLAVLPLLASAGQTMAVEIVDAFYRAGALVFGGGHVVLPLLQAEVVPPGWVSESAFLAGYGAAQAVPGPLFTFSAYLGFEALGVVGALLALGAIFVPGFLLLLAVLPFWDRFRGLAPVQSVMKGANAAVVGLLGAALYQPVWTSGVTGPGSFFLAVTGFLMLTVWRTSALWVVLLIGCAGWALAV